MLPDLRPPAPRRGPDLRRVAVLGSTGSIGEQTLQVADLFPDRLQVVALTAGTRWERLAEQARALRPERVAIADPSLYAPLADALRGTGVDVAAGADAVRDVAIMPGADVVVAAIVGSAGVESTLAAVELGRPVALANKESLVMAGALVAEASRASGAVVIPVDSEHSALFQCLLGEPRDAVERLIVTGSGGPFRQRDARTFDAITPAEAVAHPTWSMGAKISVDSATLMNKGLEVIEAHWLFGIPADRIDVTIHPQSIVHSVVEFVDGSSKAQVGPPTMKVPIQVALSYPERWPAPHPRLDWTQAGPLAFEAADRHRFPCLDLAYDALRQGGGAPAALNAANEVAVSHFLSGAIRFTDIPRLVEAGLHAARPAGTLDDLQAVDAAARRAAEALVTLTA
ncbi:MAG: 1-deoxy-D-xylulose-5-phosphate reductoisomerase [Bacteroidota bacterium]